MGQVPLGDIEVITCPTCGITASPGSNLWFIYEHGPSNIASIHFLCKSCKAEFVYFGRNAAITYNLLRDGEKPLLDRRQETHGDAWIAHGALMHESEVYRAAFGRVTEESPYGLAWMMIVNKLIRASFDPTFDDHWKDIVGYAQLVLDDLAKTKP